ncbi:MAG: hypothetical protein H7Y22_14190 [Gemmatimonadaceae bacterium]|nr:hypothetical protein [Gloeobacterales cyanobacterium ES-bin-141]
MELQSWPLALQRFQQSMVDLLFGYLPNLLGALLTLLVGWLIAAAVSRLVQVLLRRLNVQKFIGENIGLRLFEDTNLKLDVVQVSGQLTYWFLLITALLLASEVAGVPQVAQFLGGLFTYIPQVFSAVAILFLAVLIGSLLRRLIVGSLAPEYGYIGTATQAFIYGLALLAALAELGISRVLIYILFGGIVGLVMISGGIAFGLGGRDAARDLIEQWRKPGADDR